MAVTDYNKTKKLDVDSISGTPTVGKAQPILVVDGDDSTTGNGDIVIDFTNIADASDIAVYDQDGNLLDYEIEELDTSNNTAVLWCYDSWVRDGTTQAQVVYGNGDTDRQNVTGTWSNTGQNAILVQHLNDLDNDETTNDTVFDSTANDNDGTVTGAVSTTGEFDGGADGDGSDDDIIITDSSTLDISGDLTLVGWINWDGGNPNDNSRIISKWESGGIINYQFTKDQFVDSDNSLVWRFTVDSSSTTYEIDTTSQIPQNEWVQYVGVIDSGNQGIVYQDGLQENSQSISGTIDTTADDLSLFTRADDATRFSGGIDEVRLYSELKDSDWVQADYDASPKAGQVFFTQQAAETTATTVSQTVNDSLTLQENQNFTLAATLSDSLQMQENTPSTLIDTLSDNVGFTENLQIILEDTLTDQLGLQENTATTLIDTLEDQLEFTDRALFGALFVGVSDSLTFGEQLDTQIQDTLSDQVQFQEQLIGQLQDTISDQVQFQENFQIAITELLQDQLGFQENIAAALATTLTDQLSLQDQITASILTDLDVTQPTKAIITNENKFAVMESQTFKEGDTGDKVKATLEDSSGAIDVSGVKQINLKIKDRTGTKVLDEAVTITDGVNGEVEYKWTSSDTPIENAGVYRGEFEIIDANDEKETIPNDGAVTLEVEEQIE